MFNVWWPRTVQAEGRDWTVYKGTFCDHACPDDVLLIAEDEEHAERIAAALEGARLRLSKPIKPGVPDDGERTDVLLTNARRRRPKAA